MTLKHTYEDLSELWACPECPRQLLISWQPFSKQVLFAGDDSVSHAGGKGGVIVGPARINQTDWDELLEGIDFSELDYGDEKPRPT
jgi:hypothetical protein